MGLQIREQVSLQEYTTLHVGGPADYFVEVNTIEELQEALQFAKQTAAPPLCIGSGSNLLVSDIGYRGLVIKNSLRGRIYHNLDNKYLQLAVGAGEIFDEVVLETVEKGYWGLENLSAIPGTVGATPVQNVGAYGVEVSTLISEVIAVDIETGTERTFSKADCAFGYRQSFFKTEEGRRWIITQVVFRLCKKPRPRLEYVDLSTLAGSAELTQQNIRSHVQQVRSKKFPDWLQVGTAGSFFKNPIVANEAFIALKERYPDLPGYPVNATVTKVSLGWILDHVCDLRGYCQNGVCLYENQALVLVNQSAETSSAIETFAQFVADQVFKKTNIVIEREVRSI